MADVFMKNIVKKTLRTKESLRETFGKVDRTTDEQFEEGVNQFNLQQKNADRIQKELKNYITCLRVLSQAGKGLNEAIRECYEPHWDGVEHIKATTHSLDLAWDDYLKTLNEEALLPLNYYCSQFVDLKTKIAKRGRKLVDFDATRHNFNSVHASSRKDETKSAKAKEQMNIAKKLYDDLNNELLVALPDLYDSRVSFIVKLLRTIFSAEETFHAENTILDRSMQDDLSQMNIDEQKANTFTYKKNDLSPDKKSDMVTPSNGKLVPPPPSLEAPSTTEVKYIAEVFNELTDKAAVYPSLSESISASDNAVASKEDCGDSIKNPFNDNGVQQLSQTTTPNEPTASSIDAKTIVTASASTPVSILYKVRATHRYTADDTDELSFEAGEVILVVPCNDTDDMDEGWLTGIKESSGEKGFFPENFTKRI